MTRTIRSNADSRFVELRKSDVGNASGEEGNASAARTGGGKTPAMAAVKKVVVNAREKALALGKAEQLQDAYAAGDGLQARALVETQNAREVSTKPCRIPSMMAAESTR